MIVQRQPDEIRAWFVSFHTTSRRWWAPLVGRYKHVAAFGYSEACRTWVWLDFGMAATKVLLLPAGAAAESLLGALTADASVLRMEASGRELRAVTGGAWCVTAVKCLLGLRGGALRPDGLWRLMVANGATIVHARSPRTAGAGPAAASPAAAGGARPAAGDAAVDLL